MKQKNLLVLFSILSALFGAQGCSTSPQKPPQAIQTQEYGPEKPTDKTYALPEVMGPAAPVVLGPEAPEKKFFRDRVTLVFGPGLNRGFYAVGVLKALHELKIPIQSIYASETPALVSALYLSQPSLNRLDWALLKFSDRTIEHFDLQKVSEKIKESFKDQRLESLRTATLRVAVRDKTTRKATLLSKGALKEVLSASFRDSTRNARSYFTPEAMSSSNCPVIVFQTVSPSSQEGNEMTQANLVVSVALAAVSDVDLKQKNDAQYAGKKAVMDHRAEFLALVGRKEEPEDSRGRD